MKSCTLKGQQKVFFIQNNQVASCCRAHPVPLVNVSSVADLEQLWRLESHELDQGIELKGCETCWEDERQGQESLRQRVGSTPQPNTLELFMDNTCNQMCSYCSPKFSSTWQHSIHQQGMFQRISASAKRNLEISSSYIDIQHWLTEIHDYIDRCSDSSVELVLLGGEPLMQIRSLQSLLLTNLNKISKLKITTNLNPPNPKFLHWVLDNFPKDKLQFAVSIDATPEYNHVPRGGFNREQFNQNLNLLKQHQVRFYFLSVVSALSVFDLSRFSDWAGSTEIFFSKINNPDCLHPRYLPVPIKQQILESISASNVPRFVFEMLTESTGVVDLKLFEQYNYLTQYFQRTGVDPRHIDNSLFREYWNWLETLSKEKI